MTCEILVTTAEGQRVAGWLRLKGGRVVASPKTPADGILLRGILAEPTAVLKGGRMVQISLSREPEAWLKALPYMYTGSYLRAGMLSAEEESKLSLATK